MIQFLFNNIKLCLGSKILGNFLFLSLFLCIIFIAEKKKKENIFLALFCMNSPAEMGPYGVLAAAIPLPKGKAVGPSALPQLCTAACMPLIFTGWSTALQWGFTMATGVLSLDKA